MITGTALTESNQRVYGNISREGLGLTRREIEVLNWVTDGKTNAEIGLILGASPRTIQKHLEHVFVKLGVETRTAAAVRVLDVHHVPTLGLEPETFVLLVAVVETLAGAFLLTGIMIRPMAVGLFVAFAFFSVVLWEGVFSHIIAYGLLFPLLTNRAGQWCAPLKMKAMQHTEAWDFVTERYRILRMGPWEISIGRLRPSRESTIS